MQAPGVDHGPNVLEISEPVLTALAKGLRTEIALREELRKQLAALKTPAQYQQCTQQAVLSPEHQKLAGTLFRMPDNVKPEEFQRRMLRAGKMMEALLVKKCGADPGGYSVSELTGKRLVEIERKAADAAGPIP